MRFCFLMTLVVCAAYSVGGFSTECDVHLGVARAIDASAPLASRVEQLIAKWPNTVAKVSVRVKVETPVVTMEQTREVLIVSANSLMGREFAFFSDDYVAMLGTNTVSFPMSEGAGHLFTRVGSSVYDYGQDFVANPYYLPRKARLETMIQLSDSEMGRLQEYVQHVKVDYRHVIGPFNNDGTSRSNLQLNNNLPTSSNEGHNCTSWIALAPIGDHGEPLKKLIGGSGWDIHRNPGWWTAFINAKVGADRAPITVLITPDSLEEAQRALAEKGLEWNYDLH